ncbi:hypothetical protein LC653_24185 [Nostoc sp. CHAB 5784]|nr:hypothetical protein [Nostoc mirabile CHAB5784]
MQRSKLSRWALKNITRLRNVNRLKADIQSVSGALHKFTQFGLIVPTYLHIKNLLPDILYHRDLTCMIIAAIRRRTFDDRVKTGDVYDGHVALSYHFVDLATRRVW